MTSRMVPAPRVLRQFGGTPKKWSGRGPSTEPEEHLSLFFSCQGGEAQKPEDWSSLFQKASPQGL